MTIVHRRLAKIVSLFILIVLIGVLAFRLEAVGSTFANSSGNNGIELTIDSYSIYNGVFQTDLSWELKDLVPTVDKFFSFDDIKPGDSGVNTISLHLEENPAYVCLDFTNLVDEENGVNEPESLVDLQEGGELSSGVEFFAWHDDGDNTFEVGEKPLFGNSPEAAAVVLNDTTYPLSDTTTEAAFQPGETYYVGITWCAGALEVDLATGAISCDNNTLGNEYQTDSFTVDVSLRAVEASSFTNYQCAEPTVDLYLSKQISGVNQGFALSDFSYRIVGEDTDIVAPHDSYTSLPVGTYTIEELVPEGFVKGDWRIGWWGQCEHEDTYATTLEIEDYHIKYRTLSCLADNQFRPDTYPNGYGSSEAEGEEEDVVPPEEPEQVVVDEEPGRENQRWSRVETPLRLRDIIRQGSRR